MAVLVVSEPFASTRFDEADVVAGDWPNADSGRMMSPMKFPKMLTTLRITLPNRLLLAKVTEFAETLASPVLITESPPVLRLV